jgi:tetratricopeptide (TPR) repeat protein
MNRLLVFVAIAFLCFFMIASVYAQAVQKAPEPMRFEQAKDDLLEADFLIRSKQYPQAISILEKIVAVYPKLFVDYSQKLHLQSMGALAEAYFFNGDWEKARHAFELSEEYAQESFPGGDSISVTRILQCREKLIASGKVNQPPVVIARSSLLPGGALLENGETLVSAEKFARTFGLQFESKPGSKTASISEKRTDGKRIQLAIGSTSAVVNGEAVALTAAPSTLDGNIMVPLSSVAELFDIKVQWRPKRDMVFVSMPK